MDERGSPTADFAEVVRGFLAASHEVAPHALSQLIIATAQELGAADARVWLADHQLRVLVHLTDGEPAEPLPVGGSLAGRAFIASETHVSESDDGVHAW